MLVFSFKLVVNYFKIYSLLAFYNSNSELCGTSWASVNNETSPFLEIKESMFYYLIVCPKFEL